MGVAGIATCSRAQVHEGPSTSWIDTYIPLDERTRVREAISRAIGTKEAFELEHRVLGADGTVRWVFSRAIALLDEAGEIAEWFGAACCRFVGHRV